MKLSKKLGAALILLNVADGVLTAIGVRLFGTQAEGNPFVRSIISEFGPEIGLALVKLAAIACICLLIKLRANQILLFLTGLYTGVVVMWLLAFYHNLT